jgi:hypothetical protein
VIVKKQERQVTVMGKTGAIRIGYGASTGFYGQYEKSPQTDGLYPGETCGALQY